MPELGSIWVPPRRLGPIGPPVGGKAPGPRPPVPVGRIEDPETPAGACDLRRRPGRVRSAGSIRAEGDGGKGSALARACAGEVRTERWEMPLWGEVGWNFRRGLPQGFRGKPLFLKPRADGGVSSWTY